MNRVGLAQYKWCDFDVESIAFSRHHLVRSKHRSEWRFERAARGVLERLTRLESRLLTDYAEAPNLCHVFFGISDDPVSTDQLYCVRTLVGNLDPVEKEPELSQRVRLRLGVAGRDMHTNISGDSLGGMHAMLGRFIVHA